MTPEAEAENRACEEMLRAECERMAGLSMSDLSRWSGKCTSFSDALRMAADAVAARRERK